MNKEDNINLHYFIVGSCENAMKYNCKHFKRQKTLTCTEDSNDVLLQSSVSPHKLNVYKYT